MIHKYSVMIENILVLKNYNILISKHGIPNSNDLINPSLKHVYNDMETVLINSAKKFIKNLDQIIVDQKTVATTQEMFKDHMIECYKHWSAKSRNILYCDLDVIFLRPCDVFSMNIQDFCMPGTSCGIRYYPHTMRKEVWDLMFKKLDEWDTDTSHWSYEQWIYGRMLDLSLSIDDRRMLVKDFHVNQLTFSDFLSNIDNLHAVHLGSTTDPPKCLDFMKKLADLY